MPTHRDSVRVRDTARQPTLRSCGLLRCNVAVGERQFACPRRADAVGSPYRYSESSGSV